MNKTFWLPLIIISFIVVFESGADFSVSAEDYKSRYEETIFGRRFYNIEPVKHHNAWDMIKWGITGKRKKWPKEINIEPGDTPIIRVETGIRYTVVNHSTVLIQVNGINILTDPIWSMRASMLSWIGPKRVMPPGITFDQLPPIDVVLISHNHYDHMDIPTLERLAKRDNPLILTGIGNKQILKQYKVDNVKELDWWQKVTLGNVEFCFTPARHFSSRGVTDYNLSLWGSFIIKTPSGVICFIGDSGYGSFVGEIRRRFGPVDLSFIPIGAYEPAWMMETIHLTPEEAWQVHEDLGSRLSVAIHFGTFQLTDEGINEPVERLGKVILEKGEGFGKFLVPTFGKNMDAGQMK
ncbi:outer membrane protein roma [hydrocarbon metagenome]|uniref:Outer membrane protein roma n=1 Tax=hydrocarbon metagenome TaxID=938273 RepID=A0A0W8FKQ6_9ZZZZ